MAEVFQNPSDQVIKNYLEEAKTIAVVGLSDRQDTAAFRVAQFLQEKGYHIVPVNPKCEGQLLLGQKVYAHLQDIPYPIDIVDVFRRSEALPQVAKAFLEIDAKVFWAQLGLESEEAAFLLTSAGRHHIVMDRCIKIDYQNLLEK